MKVKVYHLIDRIEMTEGKLQQNIPYVREVMSKWKNGTITDKSVVTRLSNYIKLLKGNDEIPTRNSF